jgi:lysophospholipase L1-like esterase
VLTSLTGRLRWVAIGLVVAACVVATSACSSAGGSTAEGGAAGDPLTSAAGPGTYLALGDSVPFGFRGGLSLEYRDPTNFVGYPELIAEDRGFDVVNASCPGETTASFLDTTAQSNGCTNSLNSPLGYRANFPLHVHYDSLQQSQLEFAVETLKRTPDVGLVTLQIGANDGFLCQQTTPDRCAAPAELQAVAQTVQTNVDQILSTLRDDGGYDGQIVVVTYYALDNSPATAASMILLNEALSRAAQAHDATVADGFGAFQSAAAPFGGDPVAAGLVLPHDVHPSERGQRLLAQAVEKVVEG